MRLSAVLHCLAFASTLAITGAAAAAPDRVTGPVVHDNLAIYFIHGPSRPGPVPLTLDEALGRGLVQVRETGEVNALEVENLGSQPVFIQAGDIVKGGKQDRTLLMSLVLPPKSGRVPVNSFCVEHGRWSARAREDVKTFSSAAELVPSREMKLAMQAPLPEASPSPHSETGIRQERVWDGVQAAQQRLSGGAGGDVRSPQSASSLQLALENEKLAAVREAYVKALKGAPGDDDIVGIVFSVNGKLNSGDVYTSNALFKKMWPRLLAAAATEAIGQRNESAGVAPSAKTVSDFMASADAGKSSVKKLEVGMQRVLHETDQGYLVEAANGDGWQHRSYLVK